MCVHIQILGWVFSLKRVDTLKLTLKCVAKVLGYISTLYRAIPLKRVDTLNFILKYFTKVLHTCQSYAEVFYLNFV